MKFHSAEVGRDQAITHQNVPEIPSDAATTRARNRVHILLSIVFWLTIFEGAARKWGPASLSSILYFVKDPFVIAAYLLAIKHRLFAKHWLVLVFAALSFVLICLGVVDILFLSQNPFVIALGIRSYLLYTFVAFLWPMTMSAKQLEKVWRALLVFSLPMAVLVFIQYHSSPAAQVNTLIKGEVSTFVTGGHVRPTGTFSFVLGQSVFDIFLVSVVFGELYKRSEERVASSLLVYAATAAAFVAVSFSVSRTAAIGAAASIAGALFSTFFPGARKRFSFARAVGPILVFFVVIMGTLVFLPEGANTLVERHEGAVSSEGSEASRALDMLTGAGDHSLNLSAIGIGVGRGSPAALAFVKKDIGDYISEYEVPRVLQELGVFVGSAYLLFRFALAFYLMKLTFQLLTETGNPSPFILAIFCAIELISGDVESNPSVGALTWAAVALTLAAVKAGVLKDLARRQKASSSRSMRSALGPR